MGRLSGKVAIITGAAGGQGAAEAKLFAKEGAKVVATDMNEELLQKTVREINEEVGSEAVIGLKQNVSIEDDWEKVVSDTVENFGKVDILVNNAGIGGNMSPSTLDYEVEQVQTVLNINTVGNFIGIKAVVPEMMKNGSGSIINISSIAAMVGGQGGIAYQTSKGGTRAMTKAAAVDLAKSGIRVNSVHPGAVVTPMLENAIDNETKELIKQTIPLNFLADPIDIAYGVLFLASDESRFMTGAELVIDGGTTAQ